MPDPAQSPEPRENIGEATYRAVNELTSRSDRPPHPRSGVRRVGRAAGAPGGHRLGQLLPSCAQARRGPLAAQEGAGARAAGEQRARPPGTPCWRRSPGPRRRSRRSRRRRATTSRCASSSSRCCSARRSHRRVAPTPGRPSSQSNTRASRVRGPRGSQCRSAPSCAVKRTISLGPAQPVVQRCDWPGQNCSFSGSVTSSGVVMPATSSPSRYRRTAVEEVEGGVALEAVGPAAEGQHRGRRVRQLQADAHVAVEGLALALGELDVHVLRQVVRPRGGHVHHPGVGDGGGEAVLEGERPRHPVAGLADADEADPVGVHVGAGHDRVDAPG